MLLKKVVPLKLSGVANAKELASCLPTERQIIHQTETPFTAFIHFGMNTFSGLELGTGKEDLNSFNPTELSTDQWVEACMSAGITGIILTAKHHDGFCLFPSKYTEFSVKNTPYKNGEGNIVKELYDSCQKAGLKFGFYLSPFDMNCEHFGKGDAYNDYFINQMREIKEWCPEVFEVWFDGFITEEFKGKQSYDFDRISDAVRELWPLACRAIAPPDRDIAWVGNEHGLANGNTTSIKPHPKGGYYYAKNECDVSIRKGWFYHADQEPKSLKQLMHIYYNSIGQNCTLLLNLPPDKKGLLDDKDVKRLKEFGAEIEKIYASPIEATEAKVSSTTTDYTFSAPQNIKTVELSENVNEFGERITKVSVYKKTGGMWLKVGGTGSVGEKTLIPVNAKTTTIRIVVKQALLDEVYLTAKFYG